MNPYEKTAEAMKRQSEGPKRFTKNALGLAATVGASTFAPLLARAAPFLSQYIPEDLAIKGLSKINPRFGKFIKDALDSGHDFDEVKNFIGEQINESKTDTEKNIIQQISPELHQFIDQEIRGGLSPLQAGAKASVDKKFIDVIKNLTKQHKMPWASILESVYGGGDRTLPEQGQQMQQEAQPPQQQQQGGKGQQALMQIRQKINERIGG